MKNHEDNQFLQSIKSDHQASFGRFYKTSADEVRRREAHKRWRLGFMKRQSRLCLISTEAYRGF